jgi:hypothetical protein
MSGGRKKHERPDSSTPKILGTTLASTTLGTLTPSPPTQIVRAVAAPTPMTWDAAVAEYRRQPSDHAFNLMGATYRQGRTPALSEVVFPIAIGHNSAMSMRHLATALFVDKRLLDANHFAGQWLTLEPESFDAHHLKATICVDRGELRTAADHYNKLGLMRPSSIEVARLRLMLHLRTNQLRCAQEHAREFLTLPNLTPPDVLLVAETGVRGCDPDLVGAAVLRRSAPYNQRGEQMLREVCRIGLLRTLTAKAAAV